MAISNIHLTHSLARSNNIKLVFATIVLIYFAWMDIALYMNLQRWMPPFEATTSSISAGAGSGAGSAGLIRISQQDIDSLTDPHHPPRPGSSRRLK